MRVRRPRWRWIFKTGDRERQKKSGARRCDAAAELCLGGIQIPEEKVASGSGEEGEGRWLENCEWRCEMLGIGLVSNLCRGKRND